MDMRSLMNLNRFKDDHNHHSTLRLTEVFKGPHNIVVLPKVFKDYPGTEMSYLFHDLQHTDPSQSRHYHIHRQLPAWSPLARLCLQIRTRTPVHLRLIRTENFSFKISKFGISLSFAVGCVCCRCGYNQAVHSAFLQEEEILKTQCHVLLPEWVTSSVVYPWHEQCAPDVYIILHNLASLDHSSEIVAKQGWANAQDRVLKLWFVAVARQMVYYLHVAKLEEWQNHDDRGRRGGGGLQEPLNFSA